MAADAAWCIVPAAGRGARFGAERPKQYVELAGRPLIEWTLARLAAAPCVAGLVVVLAPDDPYWASIRVPVGKPVRVATGGAERCDSVLAGLRALPGDVHGMAYVLVHDAARPCVRADDITRLLEQSAPADGGLLAAPLRDTLKRADDASRVLATEPRESRWRALTPQAFRRDALIAALEAARAAGVVVTDEAMAMERIGHRPLLVEGDESNIKVTTPADLVLAEYLLSREYGIGNREQASNAPLLRNEE